VIDKHANYTFIRTSILYLVLALVSTITHAEAVPDGSLGPADALQGPDYVINQDLGRTAGNNLFHSFETFNVNTGESATFFSSPSIENIISRVTGDQASWIDGPLRGRLPGTDALSSANLYFLNPNGIIFGPNASLDIGGSFHASTAEELEFDNGEIFNAHSIGGAPILSAAKPEAFGFLGEASIELRGTVLQSSHEIALSAGTIALLQSADMIIQGGGLNVTASERVILSGGSRIDYSSYGYEENMLRVEAPIIELKDRAFIVASLEGFGGSAGLSIMATERLTLVGSDLMIIDFTGHLPSALSVEAPIIELEDHATIISLGSELSVTASERLTLSGGSSLLGLDASALRVDAPVIELQNGAYMETSTEGSGQGGELNVTAAEHLTLSGTDGNGFSSYLLATTFAKGNGGAIEIQAPVISITDGASIASESEGTGNAGPITVVSNTLHMADNSSIYTAAQAASSGDINIRVRDIVHLQNSRITTSVINEHGSSGNITIIPPKQVVLMNQSRITTKADAAQNGTIHIVAEQLIISSDSFIGTPSQVGDIEVDLEVLSTAIIDVAKFLDNSCAKQVRGKASSFVVNGTGGTIPGPDHFLPTYALNATPQFQRVAAHDDENLARANNVTPSGPLLVATNVDVTHSKKLDWSCN